MQTRKQILMLLATVLVSGVAHAAPNMLGNAPSSLNNPHNALADHHHDALATGPHDALAAGANNALAVDRPNALENTPNALENIPTGAEAVVGTAKLVKKVVETVSPE